MVDCSFCKTSIPIGTGKILIRKTGKIFWFCSNKCEKNLLKLKRSPLKLKWAQRVKQVVQKATPKPKPIPKAVDLAEKKVEKKPISKKKSAPKKILAKKAK